MGGWVEVGWMVDGWAGEWVDGWVDMCPIRFRPQTTTDGRADPLR